MIAICIQSSMLGSNTAPTQFAGLLPQSPVRWRTAPAPGLAARSLRAFRVHASALTTAIDESARSPSAPDLLSELHRDTCPAQQSCRPGSCSAGALDALRRRSHPVSCACTRSKLSVSTSLRAHTGAQRQLCPASRRTSRLFYRPQAWALLQLACTYAHSLSSPRS